MYQQLNSPLTPGPRIPGVLGLNSKIWAQISLLNKDVEQSETKIFRFIADIFFT